MFFKFVEARTKSIQQDTISDNIRFGRLCAVLCNMLGNGKKVFSEEDFFVTEIKEKKKQQSVDEMVLLIERFCARHGAFN